LHFFQSCRRFFPSLLIATGIVLFTSCQGLAPVGSSGVSNGVSTLATASSTLSFGNVQTSKSTNLSETLTNTGASAVTISAANISGKGFSASGLSLPMTLSPKQDITFTVIFAPTAAGSASGNLAIVSTANNSTLNIALSGTGTAQSQSSVPPALAASSSTLSFGNVQTSKSTNLSETLTNTGGAALTISQATISATGFSVSGLSLPVTLSPKQSVTFTVIFAPTAAGSASGNLAIVSTANNSTLNIALSGTGTAQSQSSVPPALAASSSTLSFGNVQTSKSTNLSETLTNTGGAALTISQATISATGFSVSGLSLPVTLSPKQSVTFTVIFAPTAAGSASGNLAIVSTANNSTLNIALSGTGTAQGQLSVSPTGLSFGNVVVGFSGSLNGTLGATGSSVTISAASLNSNEFALSGISVPTTLTAGQTTSFTVTFKPAASGAASATLSFSSDAANSPAAQTLTGNGTAATQHSVALSWNASTSAGVVGYNVYRGGVSGGPYTQINSALETATAYTDYNVTAGQTYYYVTTSVDGSGDESGYSNQTQAVIPTP
jgi:hypothetical protein